MKSIRKFVVSIVGALLLLIGILMIILPGPALIIIPIALVVLNSQHPDKVRRCTRKFQRGLSRAAAWMDKKVRQWG
ncbi:MAG: tellurium resistance protein TerC [Gammaproteobacteria bacterium]|nr:tellurium resistance protein TerC [Gammaproteobacteria bacterium]